MTPDIGGEVPGPRHMWHITLTLVGSPLLSDDVRAALERLADRHQFLLSARYSADRAEIRYWDESTDVRGAAARALLMWSDYSELAALPPWEVVGLEVLDQETYQSRGDTSESAVTSVGADSVRPF